MKQGKTHVPTNMNPGKGMGKMVRDAAKAGPASKPTASHTTVIRSGQVARSTGTFKGYK